jgi:hypothetical protein
MRGALDERSLRAMRFHQTVELAHPETKVFITRVHGGWIYYFKTNTGYAPRESSVFVPERSEIELKLSGVLLEEK